MKIASGRCIAKTMIQSQRLSPLPGDDPAAQESPEHERDRPDRPVDDPDLRGREPQPPLRPRVEEKGGDHLHQLRLGKTVEEEEGEDREDILPPEKEDEAPEKFRGAAPGEVAGNRPVRCRVGQDEQVVEEERQHDRRKQKEGDRPGRLAR